MNLLRPIVSPSLRSPTVSTRQPLPQQHARHSHPIRLHVGHDAKLLPLGYVYKIDLLGGLTEPL